MAKRTRSAVACVRCKAAKSKCSDYRPCKHCVSIKASCTDAVGMDEANDQEKHPKKIRQESISADLSMLPTFRPSAFSRVLLTSANYNIQSGLIAEQSCVDLPLYSASGALASSRSDSDRPFPNCPSVASFSLLRAWQPPLLQPLPSIAAIPLVVANLFGVNGFEVIPSPYRSAPPLPSPFLPTPYLTVEAATQLLLALRGRH